LSKEREQHPCLSKDQLELGWPWHREEKSKPKTKIDNNCDVCRLKQAIRKLKTVDGLTLNLCEECFRKTGNAR
jgi:ribosomal protein S14